MDARIPPALSVFHERFWVSPAIASSTMSTSRTRRRDQMAESIGHQITNEAALVRLWKQRRHRVNKCQQCPLSLHF